MYNSKLEGEVMMLQYHYMYCTLPSFRIYNTKLTAKLNATIQVDYCSYDFVSLHDNH